MTQTAIEIRDLTKKYKEVTAVGHLSLTIGRGGLFALLGVNGAGKTTTIKMLSCLVAPTEGDASLSGHSILNDPDGVKNVIAISPQENAVAEGLSVYENLELMAGAHGLSKDESAKMIREIGEKFGLDEVYGRRAGKLSGGWQRRLSIAMAWICEPEILFLVEPTLGLDVLARAELWDLVRELKKSVTVVLTTHYMEEAEELADRIGVMKNGRLIAVGTTAELLEKTGERTLEKAFIRLVSDKKEAKDDEKRS